MSEPEKSPLVELLHKAREGNSEAREELFDKCRNYVAFVARSHVESWLRQKVDASDLIQQTLLEAHRGFDQFRGQTEGEWLAWLKQILKHNAADFVRHFRGTAKRQARREVPIHMQAAGLSDFIREPVDPGASPSQIVMQHEDEIRLADAVSKLSADHQEVIMLRNIQRLPFDEVAGRMGRTRPATQMLWMRAIKKLQQEIK